MLVLFLFILSTAKPLVKPSSKQSTSFDDRFWGDRCGRLWAAKRRWLYNVAPPILRAITRFTKDTPKVRETCETWGFWKNVQNLRVAFKWEPKGSFRETVTLLDRLINNDVVLCDRFRIRQQLFSDPGAWGKRSQRRGWHSQGQVAHKWASCLERLRISKYVKPS